MAAPPFVDIDVQLLHARPERNVVCARHVLKERIALENKPDAPVLHRDLRGIHTCADAGSHDTRTAFLKQCSRTCRPVRTIKKYLAGGGHLQARNKPQQRCLSCAPRPQKRTQALQAAGCLDAHVPETGSTEASQHFLFEPGAHLTQTAPQALLLSWLRCPSRCRLP